MTRKFGINFDWTINLTHVVTFISCVVTGLLAYADLKSDVRNNKTAADAKFAEYDRQWGVQRGIDDNQDQRLIRSFTVVNDAIHDLKQDVRSDIKELRGDLGRRAAPQGYSASTREPPVREHERGG